MTHLLFLEHITSLKAKRENTVKEKEEERKLCVNVYREKESRPKNVNSKCGIITDVWIYQEKRSKTSKNVKQTKQKQNLVSK